MIPLKYALISTAFLVFCTTCILGDKVMLCYVVGWALRRPDTGRFTVLDADTTHCSHIVYAFMGIEETTNEIKYADRLIDLDINGTKHNQISKLKQLKIFNPRVKVLISIGGWSEGGKKFSDIARSPEKRKIFIKNIRKILQDFKLDGLDICWQFPGQRGGRPEDKVNSITLFRELKKAFEPDGWLLTVHILGKRHAMDSYNIKAVSDTVDYINLAAYEYNGPSDRKTGIMAPLNSTNENNVRFSVDYMISKGAKPSKLLLGLPMYGHAYLLTEVPRNNYIGLVSDSTFTSPKTKEGGIIAYHEMCLNLKNLKGWIQIWDEDSQTPIAHSGKRLVSYDNITSLILKADLVKSRSLGGVMIWALDLDDFHGTCHGQKFPLVTEISDHINSRRILSTTKRPVIHEAAQVYFPTSSSLTNDDRQSRNNTSGPAAWDFPTTTQVSNEYVGKTILCYMAAWAAGRADAGKFSVLNADTEHCTHVVYAFMTVDETTYRIASVDSQFDRYELPKLKELKRSNPKLKVLASVGGWSQGSRRFSDMALSFDRRETFITSVVDFIKEFNLDGIDMCWQFPGLRDGRKEDKENSIKLFREMKQSLARDGYLLTIHIRGQKYVVDSYDIKAVSEIVDYINFATVEYHGPWEKIISPTTPLTSRDESNVIYNLDYILKKGAPPKKLLLGLSTYGHVYELKEIPRSNYFGLYYDEKVTSILTNQPGLIGYNELCYEANRGGWQRWTESWDDFSQTPFAYRSNQFATYDNKKSLVLKTKLVDKNKLGGVMIWSLDMDDFKGLCGERNYPLTSAVADELNNKTQESSTAWLPPTTKHTTLRPFRAPERTTTRRVVASGNNGAVVSYEYGKK